MFNSKPIAIVRFATIGLATLCVSSAHAAEPTCYSRTATHYITDLSQLTLVSVGAVTRYELLGTTGNDTVVIEIAPQPTQSRDAINVKLAEPGTLGGYDYVCANTNVDYMDVSGAKYLQSRGVGYVHTSKLRDYSIVDLDGAAYVSTGNGDNLVIIDDSRNSASSTTTVNTGNGNDEILVTTTVNVVVNSRAGDDRINIALLSGDDGLTVPAAIYAGDGDDLIAIAQGSPGTRSFIVGGKGDDAIYTGDGSDLIYGSDVSYSGEIFDDTFSVNTFNDAATVFVRSSASELRSYLTPLYNADTAGGDIYTNDGNDYIYGTNGRDTLQGGSGNDYIKGYGERDHIKGGSGNDKLYGNDGDDEILGEAGTDALDGGNGKDVMKGGSGNDTLKGGADNDTLNGNEDNDALDGGSGTDTCSGDAGDDTLTGCP